MRNTIEAFWTDTPESPWLYMAYTAARPSDNQPVLFFEPLEPRMLLSAATALAGGALNSLVTPAVMAAGLLPSVTNPTPRGLTPAQIRQAYGFNQVTFVVGAKSIVGNGAGQTIAIIDAYNDPTIATDLRAFDAAFGLSNNDAKGVFALTTHLMSSRTPNDPGWALEIALDVEWAHAIAPGAHILLVEARSASLGDLLAAVDYARKQAGVVTVSMSWGSSEFRTETAYDPYFTTPAGHIGGSSLAGGVTFFASSGDSGAPEGWPAFSPNVVAVGGTTLNVTSGGLYLGETGWSGSGGGISLYEPLPTYQAGVAAGSLKRLGPDVAYNADPVTGMAVYDSFSYFGQSGWFDVGGTSAGAPQWAAMFAVLDQGRALAGKGSLNGLTQALPALYALPSAAFHDITSGNNGFAAKVGFDRVTGRGSPVVGVMIGDLLGVAPAAPGTGAGVRSLARKAAGQTSENAGEEGNGPAKSNPSDGSQGQSAPTDALAAVTVFKQDAKTGEVAGQPLAVLYLRQGGDAAGSWVATESASDPAGHAARASQGMDIKVLMDINVLLEAPGRLM